MCLTDMREIDLKDIIFLTEHELKRFEGSVSKEILIMRIKKKEILTKTSNVELLKLKEVGNTVTNLNRYMAATSKRKLVQAVKDHYLNIGLEGVS